MKHICHLCLGAIMIFAICACQHRPVSEAVIDALPPIVPDYIGVTMPVNMAAPRFELADSCGADRTHATFSAGGVNVEVAGDGAYIAIPLSDWHELTANAQDVKVELMARINGRWMAYQPFDIRISPDSIDSYLAYRLIEPGYETWNEMGIYQRCLESYRQTEVMNNRRTNHGCINCHSFCDYDPDKMLMHMRMTCSGTYIISDDQVQRLRLDASSGISSLVYPSWHPSGDFIAFSTNNTKQMFHTTDPNRIEVMDYASDVVLLDLRANQIVSSPLLASPTAFETFPSFSPDGLSLYFCTADTVAMPGRYQDVKYSVCRIGFDAATGAFGEQVDTLYHARQSEWGSASFPRVSPDGRWLMVTLSDYGNFSIWHRDADIYVIDLEDGTLRAADALNSPETESYHSWSSNGRWVVVSSRRGDGLYTRLYFAHVAPDGTISKPFVLPQDGPGFYKSQMKSYNVPEFVRGAVTMPPSRISATAHQ